MKRFYIGQACAVGHLAERQVSNNACVTCNRERCKSYRAANPDRLRAYEQQRANKGNRSLPETRERQRELDRIRMREKRGDPVYRAEMRVYQREREKTRDRSYSPAERERRRCYVRQWRKANPKRMRELSRRWRDENPDQVNAAARAAHARRMKEDLEYRLTKRLRQMLGRLKARDSITSLSELGYDAEKLIARMEAQFRDGMAWANHGEWHIDHKIPIASFLDRGVNDPKIINALSNLQPLWADDNRRKGRKRIAFASKHRRAFSAAVRPRARRLP